MDSLCDIFHTSSPFADSNDGSLRAEPEAPVQRAIYLDLHPLQIMLLWPFPLMGSQGSLLDVFPSHVGLLWKWEHTWANLSYISEYPYECFISREYEPERLLPWGPGFKDTIQPEKKICDQTNLSSQANAAKW